MTYVWPDEPGFKIYITLKGGGMREGLTVLDQSQPFLYPPALNENHPPGLPTQRKQGERGPLSVRAYEGFTVLTI